MGREEPLLTFSAVDKSFYSSGRETHATDNVSFAVNVGESVGIVGESGSGKSTIAKMITLFERPDSGDIRLEGHGSILGARGRARMDVYRRVQMVFQNPMDSFDPRLTIGASLIETARNFGEGKIEAAAHVEEILDMVGLKPDLMKRYRHQLSGGECQRAAIARALIPRPDLLICDEVTSALDVSVQAQILELICRLHKEEGLSLLVISHDLAVVGILCTRVIVLKNGIIVEEGKTDEVLLRPQHPYTQLLVSAAAKAAGSSDELSMPDDFQVGERERFEKLSKGGAIA